MNIVQGMVISRVKILMTELEQLAIEVVDETNRRKASTAVQDFTNTDELKPEHLTRIGVIQLQIMLLKGMADA